VPVHREHHRFPCSAGELFDLVIDIERYPEFVPGYSEARVAAVQGDRLRVEQAVSVGGRNWRFSSTARFLRPDWIVVRAADWPFHHLEIRWEFAPAGDGTCDVAFGMSYEMGSHMLELMSGYWLEQIAHRTVGAFYGRAERFCHGPRDGR